VGNEIIEAPMAWRSRYFEYRPFRKLIKEYFHQGAKWTAAPKPLMGDELYEDEATYIDNKLNNFVTTEFEPVFDAAEFTRIGRDIFVQRSQVTNDFGIEWMRRHLGSEYTIHELDFQDKNAMHIDGTFIPLAPGKLLVNPKRPCITGETQKTFTYEGVSKEYKLPPMFKGWDIFIAKTPQLSPEHPLYFTSPWTASCNIIMLDHVSLSPPFSNASLALTSHVTRTRPPLLKHPLPNPSPPHLPFPAPPLPLQNRVVVEAHETDTIKAFKEWGFETVLVPFQNFLPFGGSFHCATCDIRRRGELQSYF
jgi:glycine amidinotransferase